MIESIQMNQPVGVERRCFRRPPNEQIYSQQTAHSSKTVPKAADLIFAGAVDL